MGDMVSFTPPVVVKSWVFCGILHLAVKPLHSQHEEVRGQGVSLPDTSSCLKPTVKLPINFYGEEGRGNTLLHPVYHSIWNTNLP